LNPDPDFAKVQSAFLKYGKQTRQSLPQFGRLRDRRGSNEKYVLPDLTGAVQGLAGKCGGVAQGRSDKAGGQFSALGARDEGCGRRFGQCL